MLKVSLLSSLHSVHSEGSVRIGIWVSVDGGLNDVGALLTNRALVFILRYSLSFSNLTGQSLSKGRCKSPRMPHSMNNSDGARA